MTRPYRATTEQQVAANARYRAKHPERARDQKARSYARQLMRGERIASRGNHHKGMAKLKEWMGDPRPEGMTLSLVGSGSYDGYTWLRGSKKAHRLSTNPQDYIWESHADNNRRKESHPNQYTPLTTPA